MFKISTFEQDQLFHHIRKLEKEWDQSEMYLAYLLRVIDKPDTNLRDDLMSCISEIFHAGVKAQLKGIK